MSKQSLIIQYAMRYGAWLVHSDELLGELAIANALAHEIRPDGRAFVDHPSDPGGATKWGISLRFLSDLIESRGIEASAFDYDRDGDVDIVDMRSLTLDQARALLWQEFWEPYRTAELPPAIAIKVFDMAVNMGQRQAVKLLQDALNGLLGSIRLKPLTRDGVIGPKTIAAAVLLQENGADAYAILGRVRDHMESFYKDLVLANPKFESFINGWLKRAAA